MKYSEARRHVIELRQCAIFAADVGPSIAKAMTDAADFLESNIPVLDHVERRVLLILQSVGEDYAFNFNGICRRYLREFGGGISVETARRACRSLRERGLARHRNGLMSETDGAVAGSGYSVTTEGAKFHVEEPKAS